MIRKTKASDYKKIESLMISVDGFWDKSWRENVVKLGVYSSDNLSYVYVHKDKIVGFICAHDCGFRAYLSELVVHPSTQRKGVATKLLKRVENDLKKRKCKTLIADVWKDVLGFYKKQGWSKPNVVLMRKRVD